MKNVEFKPNFLVSGVGSVPHIKGEEALSLIWSNIPRAPHWPQLPGLGDESSFVAQYLNALFTTRVVENVSVPKFQTEAADWMERMTSFYELYLRAQEGDEEALQNFGFNTSSGEGFDLFCRDLEERGTRKAVLLKGQLSGSLTLGMQITDHNRKPCYYDEVLRDMLVKNLAMHAEWQTRRLQAFGLPVLMTIDDPGLYAFGASTHVTLDRTQLIDELNSIADGILRQNGIPGVHVCAGMDWTLVFDSKINVVNFDAYGFMTSMMVLAESVAEFLERGGVISWGIVPTSNKAWEENAESIKRRLDGNIRELVKRGVDESRLRQQSMITPSCGAGTLSKELAEHIYKLLSEIGTL
ncbi:hypothetical protein Desaci_3770 [Desulfosporosinus acidiphilus SJ4]|uniref:Methionine synthase II (Cobalamin-independent) n=1 Tax=Desulfosporosinus acidiphilus (strain DSM 22704 / JCM 16185 / SJ4) TaxID=646529 RepID=I4DA27_DESAJ|nr:hypothetical protein Desaci_3770 [Desulfosporosinus acidiphilus SJ4]